MDINDIRKRFPTICQVADHPRLVADIEAAAKACEETPDSKGLLRLYQHRQFAANELTFWMCLNAFAEIGDDTADEIERHLAKVVAAVGLPKARSAYRLKLLAKEYKQFMDVRYEIAAAAGAADFFDKGSMDLEPGIGDALKNSDLKGKRNGNVVRMEVRVVHDDWPPRIDPALEEVMLSADVPVGYTVSLRFPVDAAFAARVKSLVEALYTAEVSGAVTAKANDVEFSCAPLVATYETCDDQCPVMSVSFELEPDVRLVSLPGFMRAMVDPQEREFFENAEGTYVFNADLADKRTYKDQPLSTKIAQAVQGKARQCETGVCNVVVLGTHSPMVDHDVDDAFIGPVAATYVKKADGSFASGGPLV
ncbi:MAG TPA: hypothetical protein VF669_05855 [Tepidisphaeraceae bacterium]